MLSVREVRAFQFQMSCGNALSETDRCYCRLRQPPPLSPAMITTCPFSTQAVLIKSRNVLLRAPPPPEVVCVGRKPRQSYLCCYSFFCWFYRVLLSSFISFMYDCVPSVEFFTLNWTELNYSRTVTTDVHTVWVMACKKSQLCAYLSNAKTTTTTTKCFHKRVARLVVVTCRQKVVCRHWEPSRRSSRSSSVPPARSTGTCGWTSREHAQYATTSSWPGAMLLIRSTVPFRSLLLCFSRPTVYVMLIYNSFIHHDNGNKNSESIKNIEEKTKRREAKLTITYIYVTRLS